MSDYRDWRHPPGGPPETAPDRLVDVFTAPWLDPGTGAAQAAREVMAADGAWIAGLALLAVLLAGLAALAWRRRRAWRLAFTLARLERTARHARSDESLREIGDRAVVAIARWQYGGRAPRRDRLDAPWSDWVRQLDHARFAPARTDERSERIGRLAEQLRRMRRELRASGGRR